MNETVLVDTLCEALQTHPEGPLCVAFSGGPDSTALLHALAQQPQARARGLRALHVDHGLQADSPRWAEHCVETCRRLDIPLDTCRVEVVPRGKGLEAAAREARYAAFESTLRAGEFLLTAHHREDQAETVLLKLLRGAGPEGMGGMRACRPFGTGRLWRPLLDTPHEALLGYLACHDLDSIRDPSNHSPAHARNRLRMEVLPRLTAQWPQATRAIAHSARLNRQAADYIHQHGREVLTRISSPDDPSLDAHAWLELHPALHGPVLEQWLHRQGLAAPGIAHREQLQRQIREAASDRIPLVTWPGTAIHVWRNRLYAHPPLTPVPVGWTSPWQGHPLSLPAGAGILSLRPSDRRVPSSLPELEVRLGETGIHFRPAGDAHTRVLRILYQQAGIPPWRRRRCPSIYHGDTLLAIADLWHTEAGEKLFDAFGAYPIWHADC